MPSRLRPPAGGWPLRRAAEAIGAPLASAAASALGAWLDRLCEWNGRIDLTAARSEDELVDLMVADALVLSTRLAVGARVIDVGTGAGAPGLALALLRPDLRVTLAEPLAKRAAFLRTVVGALGRLDVTLEAKAGRALADASPGAWDVALARATLPPPAWLDLAADLVGPGRDAWVFLARDPPPAHPLMAMREAFDYAWPFTKAGRSLARYERAA